MKLSPLIQEWASKGFDLTVIHSGQHYDLELSQVLLEELHVPTPNVRLEVGSGTQARQTAEVMLGVERVLRGAKPGFVLVQGDTNTTLGGALAATKLQGFVVGHVEAGCRSFNRAMPEELNRVVVDHISEILFAATPFDLENLSKENLGSRALLVGSTGVEACLRNVGRAVQKSTAVRRLGLPAGRYAIATVHRRENTEDVRKLRDILDALGRVSHLLPVVFPVHPRTTRAVESAGIAWPQSVVRTPPLGYLDFLALQAQAAVVLTDSGGIQEEAAYLGVRCFTLRNETEWTFTVDAGTNTLVGTNPEIVARAVEGYLSKGSRPSKLVPHWPQGRPPSEAISETLSCW